MVGNVLVTGGALLRQVVGPSKEFQYRTDQFLLGKRFVGFVDLAEVVKPLTNAVPERGKCLRPGHGGFPLVRGLYAFREEVMGEQHVVASGLRLKRSLHHPESGR